MPTLANGAAVAANLTATSVPKFLDLVNRVVLGRVQCFHGLAVVLEANLARRATLTVFVALVSSSRGLHGSTIYRYFIYSTIFTK